MVDAPLSPQLDRQPKFELLAPDNINKCPKHQFFYNEDNQTKEAATDPEEEKKT